MMSDADSVPQEYGNQEMGQQQSEASALVTGSEKDECSSEAAVYINGILTPDAKPVAISLVICDDYIRMPGAKGPLFDAEKSCAQLKKALESRGVMVISIVNKSRKFLCAILTNLASRKIPGSCEFLWFIFSGHGARSQFSVNGELVAFDQLIRKASKIAIKRMAFFFDCCQSNTDGIKIVNIQKEHMVLYSAPPHEKAYYMDGVSLMVTCLVELLDCFKGSLNELQSKLREKLMSKMVDVLLIPSHILDDWRRKHLPHSTSSMFDINLWNRISEAMEPVISVEVSDQNRTACVTVYSPERMMHHPKFELHSYKHVVAVDNGPTIVLGESAAEFRENSTSHVLTLPPQARKMTGKLKVIAVYGNGEEVSSKPIKVELPCYGIPFITSCTREENGFKVHVAYNPNIGANRESEAYRVEHIEIGCRCLDQWRKLHREEGDRHAQECSVTLPPSPEVARRDLQVAVKYIRCPDVIFSDPWTVEQPALSKPTITSVEHVDALTGILKFAPNQYAGYQVCQYSIHTCLNNSSHWVEVHTKKLKQQGETLSHEQAVNIPLHLVAQESKCEYQVLVKYLDITEPVKSEVHQERLEPTVAPKINVTRKSLWSSNIAIEFMHPNSYPATGSRFHRELKYEIVSVIGELMQTCLSNTKRTEIEGGSKTPFRVKVSYGNGRFKDLGHIFSDKYKPKSNVHHCISACWNVASNPCKGFIALILTTLLAFSIALFGGIYYPRPLSNQLIAVEQAIPFQLKSFSTLRWCSGVSVLEYTVEPTDFFPGFDIAVYLVDTLNLKTEHNIIPSTRYPYINETIGYKNNKDYYLLPNNYYQNPPYLLDSSVVSLRCKIDLPQTINNLSYAIIHFFDSIEDATRYQHGASSKSPVHSINIIDCVAAICTKNYTIAKNSFYFPVLTTKSDSTYQITVNFTFEVYSYVDPSTLPSAVNVANFSKNSSGEIPLHNSKVVLLYAHPPNATAYERLAHLHVSCVSNYVVRVPVYLVFSILVVLLLQLYCGCCYRKWRRNHLQPADDEDRRTIDEIDPENLHESTHLLINS